MIQRIYSKLDYEEWRFFDKLDFFNFHDNLKTSKQVADQGMNRFC